MQLDDKEKSRPVAPSSTYVQFRRFLSLSTSSPLASEDGSLDAVRPTGRCVPSRKLALVRLGSICFDAWGRVARGGPMYMVIRKYTKVRSVADAARRAKSGLGEILRQSQGFRSYHVLDAGDGVGIAVMIFDDRESANAANAKILAFVQASLHDLDLGVPEVTTGEVLVNIEPNGSSGIE